MTAKSKPARATSSMLSTAGSFTHVPRAGPSGRASAARNRLRRVPTSALRVVIGVEHPPGGGEVLARRREDVDELLVGAHSLGRVHRRRRDDADRRRADLAVLVFSPLR